MKFNRRTVTARSGMSQEEALLGLQNHPKFKEGSIISGIRRRGDRWVISLFEPKPEGDDKGIDMDIDKPKEDKDFPELDKIDDKKKDSDSDDNKSDSDSGDKDEKKPDSDSKNSLDDKINRLEKLLNKVVDALGLADPVEHKAPGMTEEVMPPAPPAPAPKPKPGGDTKEVVLNKATRPGEAPPGTLPAGAPTFSSTRVASFTASSPDVFGSVKEAKDSLDREFAEHGYIVKQIRREDGQIHALLSLR